ncbi:MAG: late competence development ComFB family protein [Clostridiales bacterium]|jgi:competence protein ComFB|nr:late competence development ComFB family protein [Clostridiales bacterium]
MAIELKNYMEDCIDYMLVTVLKDLPGCKCEHCVCDIKAIALNALPSKYVVSSRGEVYTRINSFINQFDVDVISALTQASELVAKNPRHDV